MGSRNKSGLINFQICHFRNVNNSVICCRSTDRNKSMVLFSVLFLKIPYCDPEISSFKLWGGQSLLSFLKFDR